MALPHPVESAHKKAPGKYEVLGGRRTTRFNFREPVDYSNSLIRVTQSQQTAELRRLGCSCRNLAVLSCQQLEDTDYLSQGSR